ncbi:MAG TPA: hypothetical protein HA355_00360 [Methanosphaera sp.]|nr:hypothetical protein [Methanosphaera sp.]
MKFKPSMDKSIIFGIIMILIGFTILFTNYIDSFVTQLLWPLLEGSSEGKTVLFLWLIGFTLIIISLIRQNKALCDKLYKDRNYHLKYLKIAIILLILCAFIGLFIEAYIRQSFGVSFFTILTSMNPSTSTTSPMHSHAYKSVLGIFANHIVPSHVNTGSSILQYVMPYALIIVLFWPAIYVLGVVGISDMNDLHRFVALIALTVALIGLIDGGLFSQPFLIGFGFLLLVYFSNGRIGIKYFINPVVIMGFILLLGMLIEVGGSDTTCHTLYVVNQTGPVDMEEFNVTNIEVRDDMTIYTLNSTTPDKTLIKEVFSKFKEKSDLTFMSWNFYSYLDNPTMRMRQNHSI